MPTPIAPLDVLLRSMVLQQRGFYGDQNVIGEARKRFDDHFNKRAEIPADLKSAVFGIVAYHGDETTYAQLLEVSKGEGFGVWLYPQPLDLHKLCSYVGQSVDLHCFTLHISGRPYKELVLTVLWA